MIIITCPGYTNLLTDSNGVLKPNNVHIAFEFNSISHPACQALISYIITRLHRRSFMKISHYIIIVRLILFTMHTMEDTQPCGYEGGFRHFFKFQVARLSVRQPNFTEVPIIKARYPGNNHETYSAFQ